MLANVAARLAPGALLVAGFQLTGRLTLAEYDAAADAAGLAPVARYATWDRAPFGAGVDAGVTAATTWWPSTRSGSPCPVR